MINPSFWNNLFSKDSREQNVIETLRNTYVFETLNKRELKLVLQTIHVRNYSPDEAVFTQGELGVGMYIILKGRVQVQVRPPNSTDDDKVSVATLSEGDFFGELSLVENNSRRTATAIATTETSLIGFFRPDLIEIIERQPQTGSKIVLRLAEVLGRRLKDTTTRISELKEELRQHSSRGNA